MKTLVILAHPNLKESKINKRWNEELIKYPDEVTVHNIYKKYPDLKIGEKLVSVDVNNQDKGATIEFEVQKGNTELLAYFDLANGTQTNAFYINVEKIK